MQSQTRSKLQLHQLNEVSKTYEDENPASDGQNHHIENEPKSPQFMGEEKNLAEEQTINMKMEEYAFSTENRDENNESPEMNKKRIVKEPF